MSEGWGGTLGDAEVGRVPDIAPVYSTGLLGATSDYLGHLPGERLTMIERRILRIEMVLRRAGIEVESLELPK